MKSECNIDKEPFLTRGKIGANKRMTVLLAFLRFLDESQKNVSEIHANSCVSFLEHIIFFTTDAQWSKLVEFNCNS